ncbi:hypothetical protein ACFQ4C_28170 [Larkinella insperata]|uniref:Lipoprotein n=1 Tax=Larkinella insperata TaxID=332158 RepID=A0ABW3QKV0_9BACT|nr:hypothetical protein [Larkinella insperata]
MKTLLLVLSLPLLMATCQKTPSEQEVPVSADCRSYTGWKKATDLHEVSGIVVNEADQSQTSSWVYIRADETTRYFACNLPEQARKTGTRVVFDADEFMPPPTVRLAGIPVKLQKLRIVR